MRRLDEHLHVKFLDMLRIPFYSIHLSAWMIYSMPEGFYKRILQRIIKISVPKYNLLLKLLNQQVVEIEELSAYKPMYRFGWSSEWNGTEWFEKLENEDAKYNIIDKDILFRLFNLNNSL
jgi:hypothetical protein